MEKIVREMSSDNLLEDLDVAMTAAVKNERITQFEFKARHPGGSDIRIMVMPEKDARMIDEVISHLKLSFTAKEKLCE